MKNLISLLTIMALGTAFFAQAPAKESKVRIIMDKDENGVITKLDTAIQLDGTADVQEILKQYGIDEDIDLHADMIDGKAKVMRFEMEIDSDADASEVDVSEWIGKDGEVMIGIDANHSLEVLEGNLRDLLENMDELDEESRAEILEVIRNVEIMDGEDGVHKEVKVIRFESDEDTDSKDGKPRFMMLKSSEGTRNLEDVEVDDVVSVDVRKFTDENENGVKMIREIRIVINLEEVNEEDKAVLQRAGAPVAPSIAESLQLDDLAFYPNPNDGRFRLRFHAPNEGDLNVRVVNVQGKKLYSKDLPGFSGSYDEVISIEDQAAGAYLLSISQNGQTVNKKLIKQ